MARPVSWVLALTLLFATADRAHAASAQVRRFVASIQKMLGVDTKRFEEGAGKVLIVGRADFPDADAGYLPWCRMLQMGSAFVTRYQVLPFDEMLEQTKSPWKAMTCTVALYHELGHAEFCNFIADPDGDPVDDEFFQACYGRRAPITTIDYSVKVDGVYSWCYWNEFRAGAKANPETVMMEWHGYLIDDMMGTCLDDWSCILQNNGLSLDGTVDEAQVKKNVDEQKVTRANQGKLLFEVLGQKTKVGVQNVNGSGGYTEIVAKYEEPYYKRCRGWNMTVRTLPRDCEWSLTPCSITANVPTSGWAAKGFRESWWAAAWTHFRKKHNFPFNPKELLERMNASYRDDWLVKLKDAQQKYLK